MAGNQGKNSAENGKLGGRPIASTTLQAQLFRKALAERITRDAESWITAIEDVAKGHFMQVKTASGEVKVYKKAPDPNAWEKATSRAFGKPDQSVDLTSGGEKLNFTWNQEDEPS